MASDNHTDRDPFENITSAEFQDERPSICQSDVAEGSRSDGGASSLHLTSFVRDELAFTSDPVPCMPHDTATGSIRVDISPPPTPIIPPLGPATEPPLITENLHRMRRAAKRRAQAVLAAQRAAAAAALKQQGNDGMGGCRCRPLCSRLQRWRWSMPLASVRTTDPETGKARTVVPLFGIAVTAPEVGDAYVRCGGGYDSTESHRPRVSMPQQSSTTRSLCLCRDDLYHRWLRTGVAERRIKPPLGAGRGGLDKLNVGIRGPSNVNEMQLDPWGNCKTEMEVADGWAAATSGREKLVESHIIDGHWLVDDDNDSKRQRPGARPLTDEYDVDPVFGFPRPGWGISTMTLRLDDRRRRRHGSRHSSYSLELPCEPLLIRNVPAVHALPS